jgi:hypothetical protein
VAGPREQLSPREVLGEEDVSSHQFAEERVERLVRLARGDIP